MNDLKLRKKLSQMSYKDLQDMIKQSIGKEKEDFINLLNNPYFELYEESKDLSNIILEDGKKINFHFDYLKLDDNFVFEKYFTVIGKDKSIYQRKICCTTKQIIYYRINEYLKEYLIFEDVINNKSKIQDIKKELRKLSKLKNEILNYINKQNTIYNEFNQDIENIITGVYSIEIDEHKKKIYKNMLQDIRDTKKALIKSTKINKKIATIKYHLFEDLKYYLQDNYNYQKKKLKKEIEILQSEIKNCKNSLLQKKQDLKTLQYKLKSIPKDGATKMEHFLNNLDLDLKIDSKNKNKYDTKYIFVYKIIED